MCGASVEHDCWDCVVAEEDGRGRCKYHHPLYRKVDLGVEMLRESMGADPESSFSGEPDSAATLPQVLPVPE